MKQVYLLAAAIIFCATSNLGFAEQSEFTIINRPTVGKLQRIYARESGDVFMDILSGRRINRTELWAEVHFAMPAKNRRNSERMGETSERYHDVHG